MINETADEQAELLNALQELLPGAFPDGQLDAARLIAELGVSEIAEPGFNFTWPGLNQTRKIARTPTTATLAPDPSVSLDWDDARNVLVEGDNLQALKLLKRGYRNQVKLIYIDPPYNTGETFTYNDNFAIPEPEYLRQSGQIDEQGNALTSRIETSGRKHAPWLSMMFPRLAAARQLLRRDGVILVSIDNNEVHHLRLLLDATFGSSNFVDMLTWRGARKGDGKLTAGGQDYILIYARDAAYLKSLDTKWRERKTGLEEIYAKVDELRAEYGSDFEAATAALREWFRSLRDDHPSKEHEHYNRIDEAGVWFSDNISSPNYRENLIYNWKGYEPPENGWRYEVATMQKLHDEGRLIYPEDTSMRVQIKSYLHMREYWAPGSVFYRDRRAASKALNDLMGAKVFDNPKNPDVLARLFQSMTKDNDLILDFFAGSGATGHAVWEQNLIDGGRRRWILVQAPEPPDDSESGKNAKAQGYETIFEITAERLRRAAKLFRDSTPEAQGLAFRVFRLRPTRLAIEPPIVGTPDLTSEQYVAEALVGAAAEVVVPGANAVEVAWEVAVKAAGMRLDSVAVTHEHNGVTTFEFRPREAAEPESRVLISVDAFDLDTARAIELTDNDVLILRGDRVADATTLTLAAQLQSKLVLVERITREVSL